jgi:hypothetical protein
MTRSIQNVLNQDDFLSFSCTALSDINVYNMILLYRSQTLTFSGEILYIFTAPHIMPSRRRRAAKTGSLKQQSKQTLLIPPLSTLTLHCNLAKIP